MVGSHIAIAKILVDLNLVVDKGSPYVYYISVHYNSFGWSDIMSDQAKLWLDITNIWVYIDIQCIHVLHAGIPPEKSKCMAPTERCRVH